MEITRAARRALAAAVLAAAAGCGGEPSTAEILLRADAGTPAELDAARVTVSEGDRTRTFEREDGGPTEAPGWRVPAFEVGDGGEMTVTVQIAPEARPEAAGSVTVTLRDEFTWGLDVFRRAEDPLESCLGCLGGESFTIPEELRNEPGERLWIVWSGRRQGSDVVF